MNFANKLTILRIILSFIFMLFLFLPGLFFKICALFIFVLACLSDFFDGRIAYRRNLVTDFGKLMDPIADKILTIAAFLSFVQMQLVSAWMVVLILSRELFITGLRIFAISKGKILAAGRGGKHKTVSQMVAIFIILGYIIIRELVKDFSNFAQFQRIAQRGIFILMLATVILTLTSGISYLWQNRSLFISDRFK